MIWQTTGKGTKERSEKNRKNSDKESDDDCMGLYSTVWEGSGLK